MALAAAMIEPARRAVAYLLLLLLLLSTTTATATTTATVAAVSNFNGMWGRCDAIFR